MFELKRVEPLEELALTNYKSTYPNYRKIFKIHDVVLNPKTGVAWHNKKLIEESTVWQRNSLTQWEPYPILKPYFSGDWICLPDNGYFHFLIEDLPRFLDLKDLFRDSNVIIASSRNYIKEFLDLLNLKSNLIRHPLRIENYVFSQKQIGGIATAADVYKIQSLNSLVKVDVELFDKIFVDRLPSSTSKDSARGINLAEELYQVLRSWGFKRIYFENLSLTEQMSIMRNVKVVVGFHGAGLANMVWMPTNSVLIEITSSRKTNHFNYLANLCKIKYFRYEIKDFLANASIYLDLNH